MQCERCVGWRGLRNGVVAEGSALGSQGEAYAGVPRQGAGWPGLGFSVSAMPGGVDCAVVLVPKGVHYACSQGEAAVGR
jgi:hypothetical protein